VLYIFSKIYRLVNHTVYSENKFSNNRDKNQLFIIDQCHVVIIIVTLIFCFTLGKIAVTDCYQMCLKEKFKVAFIPFAYLHVIRDGNIFSLAFTAKQDDWMTYIVQVNTDKCIRKNIFNS